MIHNPTYHRTQSADPSRESADPSRPERPPSNERLLTGSNVQLNGIVDDSLFHAFMQQLGEVRAEGTDLILELMTQGGDADTARRIALELRIFQAYGGKAAYVIGKTAVMSAGITILAAFARSNRFLTADTTLLIHERHITRTVTLGGPIHSCQQIIQEEASMLATAERVEREDFEHFVRGSRLSTEELFERAKQNCYLTAQDAFDLQLIERVLN